jgi:hypothetical protein
MTTALVVPTLHDPTMGNHSPGGLFGASCERRASAYGEPSLETVVYPVRSMTSPNHRALVHRSPLDGRLSA